MPGQDENEAAKSRMMADMTAGQRELLAKLGLRTKEMDPEQRDILAHLQNLNAQIQSIKTDFEIFNAHTDEHRRDCGCGIPLSPIPPPQEEVLDRYLARHSYCCLNYYANRFNRDHVVGTCRDE
jgi:hypothetical protein